LNTTIRQLKIMNKEKPQQLKEITLDELKKICQEYIDFVDNNEEYHEDNDYNHYIFETAMKSVFDEEVFDYINSRQD
jgi:hypothetical protein